MRRGQSPICRSPGRCVRRSEIQDLELRSIFTVIDQKQVAGFQVAMNDACGMCLMQCIRKLTEDLAEKGGWNGAAHLDMVLERLTLEELHCKEWHVAGVVDPGVQHVDDVGVRSNARTDPRFFYEELDESGVRCKVS